MIRNVSLEEISDGKLYTGNDLVKAGCEDCKGCSACCRGMGSSIVLDPLDVHRLTKGLGVTFEQMLKDHLELTVVDGLILPNFKMKGTEGCCSFLNAEGRCSIHKLRPGICRLFPLGRYYADGSFQYFLQTHECKKEHRTKVKVKKWIDTPEFSAYEAYIAQWHYFLKDLQEIANEENQKEISMAVLQTFYLMPFAEHEDFFAQFSARLDAMRAKYSLKEN